MSEGTTVILLRSQEKNPGAAAVFKKFFGVTIEEVIDGIIDNRVLVRLRLDFDHPRAAGFAISLVKFVENRQTLEKRLPELKN